MHQSVMDWVGNKVMQYGLSECITLEVGSYDENGSIREFFTGPFIGVDMREGPGVDQVANAGSLPFDDESFEVVVSTEMIEHDKTFWLSMAEMGRVLRPGGLLLVTGRGNGFPLHAYPDDFFRYMPSAAPWLIELAGCIPVECVMDPQDPGIFALGQKPQDGKYEA